MKNKRWMGIWMLLLLWGFTQSLMAQAVIFPQERQPGTAKIAKKKNVYTLSNKLFSAILSRILHYAQSIH